MSRGKGGQRTLTGIIEKKPHWLCSTCSKPDKKGEDFKIAGFLDHCPSCKVKKGACHWKNVPPRIVSVVDREAAKDAKGGGKGQKKGKNSGSESTPAAIAAEIR